MNLFNKKFRFETKTILIILGPLIAAGLVEAAPGFINNAMIAHLGADKLAAAAVVSIFFSTIMVIFYGIFSTVSALIANHHGAGRKAEIGQVVRDAMGLGLIVSIPMMWLIWHAATLFQWLGQSPQMLPLAREYLHGLTFSFIPDFATIIIWQFFFGLGKTRITLAATIVYVPIVIITNYCLMFGAFGFPRLELMGTGLGNAMGFTVILFALLYYIARSKTYRGYFKKEYLFEKKYHYKELLRVGFPIGAMWLVEVGFAFIMALVMGRIGLMTLAAHQITIQTWFMLVMIIMAIAQAVTTRMGYCFGAGKTDRIRTITIVGVMIVLVYCVLSDIILMFFPNLIIGLDFNVHALKNYFLVKLAAQFLFALSISQIFDGMRLALFGALRGLKDTQFSFWVSLGIFFGLAIPVGMYGIFILHWPAVSFWYCVAGATAMGAALLGWRIWRLSENLL